MEWVPTEDDFSQYMLSGRLKHVPKLKNEVRIFISSTFTDMYVERNALFKSVYPRLQSYCRTKWNLDFLAVDMRWGIQSGATNDHSASNMCMAELKTCQEQSLGPNFVLLLGQRYGTRQLPTVITEVEYAALKCELESLHTPEADMELLQKWFLCDTNASPPERRLQPLNALGVDAKEYAESIEPRLLSLLRAAADQCLKRNIITHEAHHRYFWSVTDEEVYNGIVTASDVENHCLCFVRTLTNLNLKHSKAWRFIDMNASGTVDDEAQALREEMHNNVRRILDKECIREFAVPWSDDGGVNEVAHSAYLEEFCNAFYDKVKEMIDKAAQKHDPTNLTGQFPFFAEVIDHNHQALEKLRTFQGRDDVLDKVKQYLESDSHLPLIIEGGSGFGKTSILAMSSLKVFQWLEDSKNLIVVRRFLGTTPESTNFEPLLRGVVSQVTAFCGMRLEPAHIDDPLELLSKLFEQLPKRIRLILFLDSLDQLSSVGDAYSLKWIPNEVPNNIRLVLSTLPEEHGLLAKLQKRGYPATAFIKVDTLNTDTSMELLMRWHVSGNRHFTTDQLESIRNTLQKSKNSPLYVKLMFDIVKNTPSYMDSQAFNKRLEPLLTAERCILYIFEELRKKHGKELMNKALYFLGFSKQGLTENEMLDMLSLDDDVLNDVFQFHVPPVRRLPTVLWRRLLRDLSEYIVERDSYGSKVLWWYHRQFIEATSLQISKLNSTERALVASVMVDYFIGKWANGKPKPFIYPDHTVVKLQLSSKESKEDRFVPTQPNILSNGKPNARKLINLPEILAQLPVHMAVEPFATEVASNIQLFVGLFMLYASPVVTSAVFEKFHQASSYSLRDELRQYLNDCKAIQRVVLLNCVIGSVYAKSVVPIFASQLLPYYGASLVVDRLLEDIYTSGLIYNAMVVRHSHSDDPDGSLIFEISNEHLQPIRRLLKLNEGDVVSASTKIVLTDLQNIEVAMRYSPKLPDGDYFQFVSAAGEKDARYFVAALTLKPSVHVFSVQQRECLGIVDCRRFVKSDGWHITDLQAFQADKRELFLVMGSSRTELLIFNSENFETVLYRYSSDSVVLATVPYKADEFLVLQPRQTHQLSFGGDENKQLKVKTAVTANYFDETSSFGCFTLSSSIVALASQDSKLYISKKENPTTYSRMVLDSSARHISAHGEAMVICTDQFVYVSFNFTSETPTLNCRMRKVADRAGFLRSQEELVCYRLGMESAIRLKKHESAVKSIEARSFAAHGSAITDFVHNGSLSLTSSAGGVIRIHASFIKSGTAEKQPSKPNRMDLQIDLLKGYGERAVSLCKKARQAAVWDLKDGGIIRRLLHDCLYDLCDAAICSHTVITTDSEGCIYFWDLNREDEKPRCTTTVRGLNYMYLRPDGDLHVLSSDTLAVLSTFSATVTASRMLQDGKIAAHGWSSDGIVLLMETEDRVAHVITEQMHLQKPLSLFKDIPKRREKIICALFVKHILIICFQTRTVFCDYFKENVLLSIDLKKPTLLKSSAEVVAIRSGQRLHLFNLDNGVSRLGTIPLGGIKDQAVLSPDGLYCFVLKAPRLLRLFRTSDLEEIGMYPCDADVACIAFTEDGKHMLAGLVDTRLFSFLLVDIQCASHRSLTEGILQKPTSENEVKSRRKSIDALVHTLDSSSDEEEEEDLDSLPNTNDISINADDSNELKMKHINYAFDTICRVWRNYSLSDVSESVLTNSTPLAVMTEHVSP